MDLILFSNSILLGFGLAMDAFSVSLANGLNEPAMKVRRMCLIAGVFAFFQFAMPMIGCVVSVPSPGILPHLRNASRGSPCFSFVT